MKRWKKPLLFSLGGGAYVALELLWRGWSHISMFFAGGSAFMLLGRLNRTARRLPMVLRGIAGAGVVTAVELASGLAVNRDYTVWDYRSQPMNFLGQICAAFSLLWIPVSMAAMALYQRLDEHL